MRFDGGPAMTDLKKLELATGLSIAYTLYVPFRFKRFADRVLGPDASDADRDALEQKLGEIGKFLLDWQTTYDKTIASKMTRRQHGSRKIRRRALAASTPSTALAIRFSPRI